MAFVSKNQGRKNQERYQGDPNCLPRHNYATGAGYKSKCRRPMTFNYRNSKLTRVSQNGKTYKS